MRRAFGLVFTQMRARPAQTKPKSGETTGSGRFSELEPETLFITGVLVSPVPGVLGLGHRRSVARTGRKSGASRSDERHTRRTSCGRSRRTAVSAYPGPRQASGSV